LTGFTERPITFWLDSPAGQRPDLLTDFFDPDSGFDPTVALVSTEGVPITPNPNGSYTYNPTGFFNIPWDQTQADSFQVLVQSDTHPGDFIILTVDITLAVDIRLPAIQGSVVYADVNQNGKHDAWERSISGVEVRLEGYNVYGHWVSGSVKTGADGSFKFDQANVQGEYVLGDYQLIEVQPKFIVEGILPSVDENRYHINSIADATLDYVFGEFGLYPKFIHPQDYLASTRSTGIVFGLNTAGNQLWYSLQDGWNGVTSVTARMNAAGTQLTLTVNGKTKVINTLNNPDFFHRGSNQYGSVVQIYGGREYWGL
jgi:hypothetical protein